MSGEILAYAIVAILGLLYLRRLLAVRSITEYHPVDVEEKMRTDRGTFLLDVRTEKEWSQNHIKGAHHIPLHELGRRYTDLEKHKSREIICYCQSGNRSLTAALRLKRLGFTVAHMKGGIAEWNFSKLR
ncbi:MAG: rhodanese-like domain-containing protein [Ignavibacteriales bacterium]|nr:rhodanese-like domain-containing protein [Ignavibacteriales bacterium]